MVDIYSPSKRPKMETERARVFKKKGKIGSIIGETRVQFRAAPPIIAPSLKRIVGKVQKISPSFTGLEGDTLVGLHITAIKNRKVYLTVSPVAKKKRKIIIIFVEDLRENSRIRSFE